MNLENKRPQVFRDLPPFPKEQLREKYTGGDIVIQACADDEQVAFHAIRNLIRKGRNAVTLRWSQSGFAAIGDRMETPRNLFGFKDGTANPTKEQDFDRVIWADSKDWMENGSYMAVRRIQMFLETWDRTSLEEQENTFGRYKESGAPFGKKNEFNEVDLSLLPDDRMSVWPRKWRNHFCVVLILTQMGLMKRLASLIRDYSSFLSRRILITLLRFKPI